jgi:hypothetical protein
MADSVPFDLHPELAAWMDREAARIAGFVQDLSDKFTVGQGLRLHPDQPIAASFGPDDIVGETIASSVDLIGQIVGRGARAARARGHAVI